MMRADRLFVPGMLGLLLVLWQVIVWKGFPPGLVPSPVGIVLAGQSHIADRTLLTALSSSFGRVLAGFSIAFVMGVPLGLAMGLVPPIARAVAPFLDALRAIAPIAWIPIAVLWLGVTSNAAIMIVTYAAVLPLALSAYQGVRLLDHRLLQAARALGAGPRLRLVAVVLPGSIPILITACRLSMGFAWGSIVAAELAVGVKVGAGSGGQGIGQMMAETLFIARDVNTLALCMLCVGLVSLAIDFLTRALGRVLSPWTQ
jgi:ABC-type nitrate/sulfonate/bicarbonate transport system permease component